MLAWTVLNYVENCRDCARNPFLNKLLVAYLGFKVIMNAIKSGLLSGVCHLT